MRGRQISRDSIHLPRREYTSRDPAPIWIFRPCVSKQDQPNPPTTALLSHYSASTIATVSTLVCGAWFSPNPSLTEARAVSYTHLRAHETVLDLVCRLLLEKKK